MAASPWHCQVTPGLPLSSPKALPFPSQLNGVLAGSETMAPPLAMSSLAGELRQAPQVGCWYVAAFDGEDRVVRIVGCQDTLVWVSVCQTCRPAGGIPTFRKRGDDVAEVQIGDLKAGPFHLVAGRVPAQVTQAFEFAPVCARRPLAEVQASNTLGHDQQAEDDLSLPWKSRMAEARFRHPKALSKMREMGFDDTPQLRDVILRNEGRVPGVLRQLGVA